MTPHGAGTVVEFSWFKKTVLVDLERNIGVHFSFYYNKSELRPA